MSASRKSTPGWAKAARRGACSKELKDLGRADIRAGAYAALGDNDEAFRLLFNVVEKRDGGNVFIGTDPQFASLHSDPRWSELLRRMNFPAE